MGVWGLVGAFGERVSGLEFWGWYEGWSDVIGIWSEDFDVWSEWLVKVVEGFGVWSEGFGQMILGFGDCVCVEGFSSFGF